MGALDPLKLRMVAPPVKEPRMAELDRLIAEEGGAAPAAEARRPLDPTRPTSGWAGAPLAARANEAMMLVQARRTSEVERLAADAKAQARRSANAAAEAASRIREQEITIAALMAQGTVMAQELALLKRAADPNSRPWTRRCFICEAPGWCEHREPELVEGPPPGGGR